ncbi:MAG TPA: ribose-5-phosphate isomerase RpiA [Chthonomonadaceae bacterium]|nr:ribose-5-phosphate isomerase RpiA [Chthonomonadaceae bacterium]
MDPKEAAARAAVRYVQEGMVLGLGSGTTAAWAIQAIGERIRAEGLRVHGVPTSLRSRELAVALNIPLIELYETHEIDLTIDGADEVDTALHLIKGGGGALVREKIVACASRQLIIICDESKLKPVLGAFPLPVAILPFGWETTRQRLEALHPGIAISLRRPAGTEGAPYVTDDGLYILDMHLGQIEDVSEMERRVKQTVGVAEVGLFVGLATRLIVGYPDGHTEERLP